MPLRRLRPDHGAASSPAEHRHHAAHRQDDRGGKNLPAVDSTGAGAACSV